MQKEKRYYLLLRALLLAACLVMSMSAALYAAAEEEATTEPGLVIVSVDPGGPAAKAGVLRGAILLALDDVPVNTVADLLAALAKVEAGATVTLQVQHGDKTAEYEVTTGDQQQRAYLGIRPYGGMDFLLTPPDQFAMPALPPMMEPAPRAALPPMANAAVNGLVVVDVLADSGAAAAGIQVNDVITAVNGEAGLTLPALQAQLTTLTPGDVISVTVMRANAEPTDLAVTLGEGENGGAQMGVQLGVTSVFEGDVSMGHPPAFLPTSPMMGRSFPFWQEGSGEDERRFFHFGHSVMPQFYFLAMPYPGWAYPGFLNYEEGVVMPAVPDVWGAAPPVAVEIQGELNQVAPVEQAPADYY
jgi:hypothetical protein